MDLLSYLFDKGEEPVATYDDPKLGSMKWSEDDEAWVGEYDGIEFTLAYERESSVPIKEVLIYAAEMLGDLEWLREDLEREKQKTLKEYNEFFRDEIEALQFERINFHVRKDQRSIFAHLAGGKDYRLWRIEYSDRRCGGIGYDD